MKGDNNFLKIKDLNKKGKKESTIDTGYRVYINFTEKWTRGFYNKIKTNLYVSSLGRVFNISKNKFEKIYLNSSGYLYCQSYYNGKRTSILINKLVLESFHGYPDDIIRPEADHINRIKLDNSLSNLQWLSNVDNLNRRILHSQKEENNSNVKYSSKTIIEVANTLATGTYTLQQISAIFNIPYTTICDIKNKNRWKDLLKNYDFSNYKNDNHCSKSYNEKDIIYVADLIQENNLTLMEISKITGMSYSQVHLIKNKRIHKDILKSYDFSNYNKVKMTFTKNELEKIDPLILNGFSPREICNKLGMLYNKTRQMSIYDRKRKLKKSTK